MTATYPTQIRVIVMPYENDRLRSGVGCGPERLLEHGAAEALGSAGAAVRIEAVELPEPSESEVDGSFELIRLVSARVGAAIREGAFPVVLSGSCFASRRSRRRPRRAIARRRLLRRPQRLQQS